MIKAPETTTITIRKGTMRELKQRALEKDMRYSDYLEELIQDAWNRRNGNHTSSNGAVKRVAEK